jgi:phosphoribosylglycinamide formyltransferase 1
VRVGVLASGEGTNLQALLETLDSEVARVVAVASDQPCARALDRAREAGVPTKVFARADHRDRASRDAAIADWLAEHEVELVVLAGYMALLDAAFIDRFRDRIVNVHPALLPAFPGLHAIEQALEHAVKVFGVTVHYVDEGIDTGPIILQRAVELPDARTVNDVRAGLQPIEHELLPRAVALIAGGRVRRDLDHPRRVLVDG